MIIKTFNEEQIQKIKTDKNHIIISFQDPNYDFVNIPNNPNLLGIVQIHCYDFDRDTGQFPYDRFLFKREHAEDILELVETVKHLNPEIYVNCVAGISRSRGCAAALCRIYNDDDIHMFKACPPNMLVYRTILEVYNDCYNR